ncbi:MAG TPA: hypothetical protein VL970_03580 [Candidatus Acidoferrales bacterium]|nr:hypothetical protein [Candidatus Acidoferrales bacterium]
MNLGKATARSCSRKTACWVPILVAVVFAASFSVQAGLEIDKAYCGTEGSWRDVTPFLQQRLASNALSATLEQPFDRIGGDPAPGQVKKMIIDYRYAGKSWRLLLKEQYPVAFRIRLPSIDAAAPGSDPLASAVMADIAAHPATPMADYRDHRPIFIAYCSALVAIIGASIAWIRWNESKGGRHQQ